MADITFRDKIALAIIRFGFRIASKKQDLNYWYGYRVNGENYIYESKTFFKRQSLNKLTKINEKVE